jgi:hypothetical protein
MLRFCDLSAEVKNSLYNIEPDRNASIAAEVVAFYAFNHGSPWALRFASSLPIDALTCAEHLSG